LSRLQDADPVEGDELVAMVKAICPYWFKTEGGR
jgi:hypothetical protein